MNKLPRLRQGQSFDYNIINNIIDAINDSIISQPQYSSMMNDLVCITNKYSTKIDSFISKYRDVVDNTPTLLELLRAYSALSDEISGADTIGQEYSLSSIKLDFVANSNASSGNFQMSNGVPVTTGLSIPTGKSIVAVETVDGEEQKEIFINCGTEMSHKWLCLDVIMGPQGPTGSQGSIGDKGDPGKDGAIYPMVSIKGTIDVTDNLATTLEGLEESAEDGYAWVASGSTPDVYVYTPNAPLSNCGYDGWTKLQNIRGPRGATGASPTINIRYANNADGTNSTIIPSTDTMYMGIQIVDPSSDVTPSFTWIKIREKAYNYIFSLKWTYGDGGELDDNDSIIVEASGEETNTRKNLNFTLKLPDIKEITDVDIDAENKFVFTKRGVKTGEVDATTYEIKTRSINDIIETEMSDTSNGIVRNSTIKAYVDLKKTEADQLITEAVSAEVILRNSAIDTAKVAMENYTDTALTTALSGISAEDLQNLNTALSELETSGLNSKVDKTTTIAEIALSTNISKQALANAIVDNLRLAGSTNPGLLSSTLYDKLSGLNNYTHPAKTQTACAAVKIGCDATGHVVFGTALSAADVGAAPTSHTHSYAAAVHTHSYAGSASIGGAASSVANNLALKLNGGTTEGTNQFTFNGSASKTIDLTPAAIGAAATGHTHADYALAGHSHVGYSVSNHNHDTVYSKLDHTHVNVYATANHTHDIYSPTSHNHDTVYSKLDHTHDIYSPTSHDHDTVYSKLDHTHVDVYATVSHRHNYSDIDGAPTFELSGTTLSITY